MVTSATNNTPSALFNTLNASSSSVAKTTASAAANTQDRFLTLLVTQMKNQDPLNPMDNAQVTSQMAQLSTVSGIDKLNVTLQALSSNMTASQSLQAAAMIGHGVLSAGSTIDLANGSGVAGVDLPQAVDKAQVSIQDATGRTVRTIDLGAMSAGVQGWQWNGLDDAGGAVPAGSYTFNVTASQSGVNVAASALSFGVVSGVTQSSAGTSLNLGQNASVGFAQVRQIL